MTLDAIGYEWIICVFYPVYWRKLFRLESIFQAENGSQ